MDIRGLPSISIVKRHFIELREEDPQLRGCLRCFAIGVVDVGDFFQHFVQSLDYVAWLEYGDRGGKLWKSHLRGYEDMEGKVLDVLIVDREKRIKRYGRGPFNQQTQHHSHNIIIT